jgi:predicted O-methyltransferase YrrM
VLSVRRRCRPSSATAAPYFLLPCDRSCTPLLRERLKLPDRSPGTHLVGTSLESPTTKEHAIISAASFAFADEYSSEDDHLAAARSRAHDVGVAPISNGGGTALHFLASVLQAKSIVEIGTGTGVSGLWLLRGMVAGGVLTSVDLEAEHQRLAREAFSAAGFAPQRFRLIAGAALDVLPRLTDAGYDLVFLDGDKVEYGEYFDEAIRLVRPGGIIAFDNALWHDRVADPSERDPETSAIREMLKRVREDERLRSILLPVGDGLLAAQLVA